MRVLTALAALAALGGCAANPDAHITAGMTEKQVRAAAGEPYAAITADDSTNWYYASVNDGPALRVCFVDGRVKVARQSAAGDTAADFGPPNQVCNG